MTTWRITAEGRFEATFACPDGAVPEVVAVLWREGAHSIAAVMGPGGVATVRLTASATSPDALRSFRDRVDELLRGMRAAGVVG